MKQHKLRIALSTNTPYTYSGYASTAREIYTKIKHEGYPLALINFYGQEGYIKEIDNVTHYPKINNPFGDDALAAHSKDFRADISITNQDTFVLDPNYLKQVTRWIPWVPIDHDPVTPAVIDRMRLAYRIITCSKFGYEQLKSFGIHSTYIPYSIDTEIFKPMDKKEMRKKYIPKAPENAFIFGMVAANKEYPSRKSFQEVLDAFRLFFNNHPDAYLYLNVPLGPMGFPILEYAQYLKLSDRILWNENYNIFFKFTNKEVAEIINCFDVSLNPSATEGFGLNVVEAQSCGVPIIVNDFVSMPELIIDGKTGWKCNIGYKQFTTQLSYIAYPDYKSLHEKMELSYTADREAMGKEGRKWVVANYDSKIVFERDWKPYLQMIEDEIYNEEEKKTIDTPPANP